MLPAVDLHNFFHSLPPQVKAEFDRVSRYRNLAAGSVIIRTGDWRESVYQIASGHVRYSTCDIRGRETVVATMKEGDWIGLSEVFADIPSMVDAVATRPVRLRVIARRDFDDLMDRHPMIVRKLLRLFSLRFSIAYRASQDRHQLTLHERLVKMLYLLSFEDERGVGTQGESEIRVSQEELAKMLSASRQTVNRLLREMERAGQVRLAYRSITLVDRQRLKRDFGELFGGADLSAL